MVTLLEFLTGLLEFEIIETCLLEGTEMSLLKLIDVHSSFLIYFFPFFFLPALSKVEAFLFLSMVLVRFSVFIRFLARRMF